MLLPAFPFLRGIPFVTFIYLFAFGFFFFSFSFFFLDATVFLLGINGIGARDVMNDFGRGLYSDSIVAPLTGCNYLRRAMPETQKSALYICTRDFKTFE